MRQKFRIILYGFGRFFMVEQEETYATVVSCMEGKIRDPLRDYALSKFNVEVLDTITDRGGLLRHLPDVESEGYVENMLTNIQVSLAPPPKGHGSKGVVVAGHQGCIGYPIPDEQKKLEVIEAAQLIRSRNPGTEVIPVFVSKVEPRNWRVEEL